MVEPQQMPHLGTAAAEVVALAETETLA